MTTAATYAKAHSWILPHADKQAKSKMLFTLMQVLCMHTVATPTMQMHIGVATVVDHNLFWLACLVTFSLNTSRMYIGLGHFLEH